MMNRRGIPFSHRRPDGSASFEPPDSPPDEEEWCEDCEAPASECPCNEPDYELELALREDRDTY